MKFVHVSVGATGGVVSNIISSVTSLVCVFPNASRNFIYTVLFASHATNICHVLVIHVCQFAIRFAVFQNATCSHHTHTSTGHVIFKVTFTEFVDIAQLLIMNKSCLK